MIPEIDALMREQINADEPGAAVAVVVDGAVIPQQGYGLANVEWGGPDCARYVVLTSAQTEKQEQSYIVMVKWANLSIVAYRVVRELIDVNHGKDIARNTC